MKTVLVYFLLMLPAVAQAASPVPSYPKATKEAVKLYQNMLLLQKKGLMFGHQDDLAYGKGWIYEEGRSDVRDVCGDYPAVCGWELGHLELGDAYSLDSVHFDRIKGWIKTTYERGGINTISWHLRNPLTGGTAWDVSSKEVVASILPGGPKHALYVQYLDKVAAFMLSLKTDKGTYIPVFFRPFHEHTGSWFWWGKNLCTPEQYKALWRFSVHYLRDTKNIHHLLYAYSTGNIPDGTEYLERYPGDDLIYLVGFDHYGEGTGYAAALKNAVTIVTTVAKEKGKIAAVTEAGGKIAQNPDWWTTTLLETLRPFELSYVLVWRNPAQKPQEAFAPYKGHPSSARFVEFYNDPKTLFLKDIQQMNLSR